MPAEIYIKPHRRGDNWRGIPSIGPILIDSAQPERPLTRVRMQFRKSNVAHFTIDSNGSGDAPAVIVNATTWEAMIPEVKGLSLPAGTYDFDIEYYAGEDTTPETYHFGFFKVTLDSTRP
ncbi:hypothetical protein [Luteolibacter luteus]|uniref:Uncharacterized protein n=1 Tax=Luteolibacter luteus TaxID=2728835 RepID=A0A858RHS0_9BACT|nr:hypothetical protein [Luteolibacter luteus]QJE95969.1 hypothetical protein HHL09_09300 [Luteolibacter luteus]